MRTAVASIAGLLLNGMMLCLPLAMRHALDQAWRDPSLVAFFLLATTMVVVEMGTAKARQGRGGGPAQADRWPLRLAGASGICLLSIFWLALFEHGGHPAPLGVACAGGLLMVLGISLRHIAMRTLGGHFCSEVVVRVDQPLIRRGIYRCVRHPSESGLLAASLGACLLLGAPRATAVWIFVMVPLALLRIALEDRQLALAFGKDFERYRQTKRLLPLVY